MEKPKQSVVFKRDQGPREKKPKVENRETRQNFWRKASGAGYLNTPKGRMLQAQMQKRRAKAKRSKAARKRNRSKR